MTTVNTASTATTAQSAVATPASQDAGFGALLQTMTGDPSSDAFAAAPNTTAMPITSFAAATLIQTTTTPDGNFSATAPAASTIWAPAALLATSATATSDATPRSTAGNQDNKDTATDTTPGNNADAKPSDAATSLLALWQLTPQATPMVTAPQQDSAASTLAAANSAAPVTAANTPAGVDQTDPTATQQTAANQADPTATDQTPAIQIASNQTVVHQTAPVAADPAASVGTVPDKAAALVAAQALAASRGTENGTPDLKFKAKSSAPGDVKPSGDKSKSVASDKTTASDKTSADKTTGVTTGEPAAGLKNSPIQPRQDGQTPSDQAPNNSSPSATVAQPAPASQSDGHAAKADAGAAQAVSVSPLASEPQKVAADLQVAAGHDGTDTSATLDKLGVTIAAKSVQGLHQFDIRLDPADLGRVQVKLTVDDNGQAQASLVVDKPQTLDLLQRDSSSLNRVLTDAGLNLSNNGLSFSLRDQQQQADGGTNKGRSRSLSVKAALAADASTIRSTSGSYAPNSVRLDIRV